MSGEDRVENVLTTTVLVAAMLLCGQVANLQAGDAPGRS
jgi:hypothetical protein